jgi:hypothetical protein
MPMSSVTADAYTTDEVILERRSLGFIVATMFLTCGLYGLVLGYSHYRAIKELNPAALDPMVAMGLSLVGYMFTAGLLSFAVDYWQWKCLAGYAEQRNLARRNKSLMTFAVAARVGGLLALWFSWTGFLALVLVGCAIYSTYLIQKELELYTYAP